MTPRTFYAPPNPAARRAGTLLLVLGGLALLIGVIVMTVAMNLPAMSQNPDFRDMLDKLRAEIPFDPMVLFVIYASVIGGYGVVAILLGFLSRGGAPAALVVSLVVVSLVGVVIALACGLNVARGAAAEAVLPLVFCVLHGVAARWLVTALAAPRSYGFAIESPRGPLQEYYLPPVKPMQHAR